MRWFAAAIVMSLFGCTRVYDGPTVALYPSPRLPRAQVVHLFGSLASIDGRDVAELGDGIEVLPGCHVVWTRADPIESTIYVSVSWRPAGRPFAVQMQPGFTYVFKRQVMSATSGMRLRVVTSADELDAHGANVRTVQPAQSGAEIAACRAAAAASGS